MHVITLVLAIIAAVIFIIAASGRVVAKPPYSDLIAWGLFFATLAFICAWTLRGDDLIYFIE